MMEIKGQRYFPSNRLEDAMKLYKELDSYGYNVELESGGHISEARYKVSWLGYAKGNYQIPKENISKFK